jgi:hypothetical protein
MAASAAAMSSFAATHVAQDPQVVVLDSAFSVRSESCGSPYPAADGREQERTVYLKRSWADAIRPRAH